MLEPQKKTKAFLELVCLVMYLAVVSIGAFSGGSWASVAIAGASILYFGVWFLDRKMPRLYTAFAWFTLGVVTFFAEELTMSSDFNISLKVWIQLTSVFMSLFLLLAPRIQLVSFSRKLIPTVSLVASIACVILGFELMSGGFLLHKIKKTSSALTEYNRGMAHLVILAFPLFAGLWAAQKRKEAFLLAAALFFPACLTESHTAKLALMLGAFCTGIAYYRPACVVRSLAISLIVLMGWPFYAQYVFTHAYDKVENLHGSWQHRVEIWDYLSYRISEHPWSGWGLGTTHQLDFSEPHGNLYHMATQAAPHAHNFVTELWVETGVIGLVLGFIFFAWSLWSANRLDAKLRPFALGAWASAIIISLFGFDFWTDALWSAFALTAFAFGMLQQQLESKNHFA